MLRESISSLFAKNISEFMILFRDFGEVSNFFSGGSCSSSEVFGGVGEVESESL
jgi:hypothetical protein